MYEGWVGKNPDKPNINFLCYIHTPTMKHKHSMSNITNKHGQLQNCRYAVKYTLTENPLPNYVKLLNLKRLIFNLQKENKYLIIYAESFEKNVTGEISEKIMIFHALI